MVCARRILRSACLAWLNLALLAFHAIPAPATEPSFSAEDIEWFEREVRPLLAAQCGSCHSEDPTRRKGGLSLESREAVLAGGDSGAGIVPGDPDASLLVEAIRRESFEMPPEKSLSPRELEILEQWVAKGAPWSADQPAGEGQRNWLQQRIQSHWAWAPVEEVDVAATAADAWSLRPLDRLVLEQMRARGVSPGSDAEPRTLLRRLSVDLLGLPASATLADDFAMNPTEDQYRALVDEMLASPQFGARWGRHWLDLVRYSETLGHEFDYPAKHAWRYRDAVIDAFNTDLPYDDFVYEHLSGDQADSPRLHPLTGQNDSLAMTAWWWLGDSVHAPVDVSNDWATRTDNQIDVFSKTFLGMTIACARCHDHKFDAIRQADYFGLAGVIESSRRSYAITDPKEKIARHSAMIQRRVQKADEAAAQAFQVPALAAGEREAGEVREVVEELAAIDPEPQASECAPVPHEAEADVDVASGSSLDQAMRSWLEQVVEHLQDAPPERKVSLLPLDSPWVVLRAATANRAGKDDPHATQASCDALQTELEQGVAAFDEWEQSSVLFADFANGMPQGWSVNGVEPAASPQGWVPEFEWFEDGVVLPSRRGIFRSHRLGRKQQLVLRSPTFDVQGKAICIKMRGKSAQSTVLVNNYFMLEFHGLLFGDLRKPIDQPRDHGWVIHAGDLNKYIDYPAFLSIEDFGKDWFEIEEVRFAEQGPPTEASSVAVRLLEQAEGSIDRLLQLAASQLVASLSRQDAEQIDVLRSALRLAEELHVPLPGVGLEPLKRLAVELQELDKKTPQPTILLATSEGTPRNAALDIRGNPHTPGELVPRGCLSETLAEIEIGEESTGRRELAASLTDRSHPLTARVMVNRVWHYLMGQGLVATPDNFGVLGGAPSHPHLLDHLTTEFVRHDWSVKWLVREIVLSRTYRLTSVPTAEQAVRDADGILLSHRRVRRLSAEAMRDAMLSAADSLDAQLAGPSVPVYLNDQMTGRGRPAQSGPLDGDNRRTVYIEVRRNFLNPFLVAFDFPLPSTTVGARNDSNVPAQALGLLNDPFGAEIARRVALRSEGAATPEMRVQAMVRAVLGRDANSEESRQALQLVELADDQTGWVDLAHVLLNSKEFLYVR
ncbi:PSD1 and planctomycete cytochrome C domain-containing protein [Aureliella helgolandensis]|uniref:Planctomycete cytochrome C n=1 Tax=Aureliella helgolandensis TaxID=2527968 RepID=A0A518GHA6_9BACT|nr:PSD1 and planctomycete cytochrome C domain-containing protein [Aureliella helgolandensis]QDV27981.1 Planctomycete cytochrome C [Aureliella helgolandensis]